MLLIAVMSNKYCDSGPLVEVRQPFEAAPSGNMCGHLVNLPQIFVPQWASAQLMLVIGGTLVFLLKMSLAHLV